MGNGDQHPADPEQALVASLSVFADGFTLEAARAVLPLEPVGTVLPNLVERAMVTASGSPPRYRVRTRVRREPAPEVRDRHLDWVCSYVREKAAGLDGPGQAELLEAIDAEYPNARAALQWGTSRPGCEPALALAAALGRFWEIRGHVREGRRWLDIALHQNPDASPSVRAGAANSAGLLALKDGDLESARARYEEGLALHWGLEDRLGASAVLHSLGNIAFSHSEWDEAQRLFDESLAIGRDMSDDRVVAASLTNLGAVSEVRGEHLKAVALYGEALGLWRGLGDRYNAAAVLENLSDLAAATGDMDAARHLAGEALEARRSVGDRTGMGSALRRLAGIARNQGDTEAADSFEAQQRRLAGDSESTRARRFGRRP